MIKKVLIGASCLFAIMADVATAAAYTAQILPTLKPRVGFGSTYSSYAAYSRLLNDKGQITEGYSDAPVLWSNGTLTSLIAYSYYFNALVINNNSQVLIAGTGDYPDQGSCSVWSNGELTNISYGCWPVAMNDAGQVVGTYDVYGSNRGRSVFLWSNGTMINLDLYDNGRYSASVGNYNTYGETCGSLYDVGGGCPLSMNDVAVDLNDNGQVLFWQIHSRLMPKKDPVPDGPVVWSNGVKIPVPGMVFGSGKSINNRGDVLGYTGNTSFMIWNVNTGDSYSFDTGYSVGYSVSFTPGGGLGFSGASKGWAKLTEQGEVYFPRTDGVYKLTPDHVVKQVMSYTCPSVNQIDAVNDQGQLVACGYINYHGIATPLVSLVPDMLDPTATLGLDKVYALNNAGQILTSKALLTPILQNIASCDANHDGKINTTDLSIIYAANNTHNAAYDVDGDGKVTVRDMRICVLQCNNGNCQP